MGIVRIGIVVDSVKEALCHDLRHDIGENGDVKKSKWDIMPEEEKSEICGKCLLAWNGSGCEGRFGPTYSSLSNFARRFGCDIISEIPKSYEERRIYESNHAQKLIDEVRVLRDKLKFEKDTVFVPQENENLPEDKVEQWLVYTVGFEGVVPRKINALRVHEATLEQLEKMAKTCVEYGCSFTFP
jgi:hypothetical protein